jgi:hypothetical protein
VKVSDDDVDEEEGARGLSSTEVNECIKLCSVASECLAKVKEGRWCPPL